jgi:hypothetical protein
MWIHNEYKVQEERFRVIFDDIGTRGLNLIPEVAILELGNTERRLLHAGWVLGRARTLRGKYRIQEGKVSSWVQSLSQDWKHEWQKQKE